MPLAGFLALIWLINVSRYIHGAATSSFVVRGDLLLFFRSVLQQIKINPYLHEVLVIQQLYFTSVSSTSEFRRQDIGWNQVLLLVLMVSDLHLLLGVLIGDHWLFYHVLKSFHF